MNNDIDNVEKEKTYNLNKNFSNNTKNSDNVNEVFSSNQNNKNENDLINDNNSCDLKRNKNKENTLNSKNKNDIFFPNIINHEKIEEQSLSKKNFYFKFF